MAALAVLLGVALLFWIYLVYSIAVRSPHYPKPGFGEFWEYWAENAVFAEQPLALFTATLFLLSVYLFVLFLTNRGTPRRGLLPERTALGAGFILVVGMVMVTDDLIDIVTGRYRLTKWQDIYFGPGPAPYNFPIKSVIIYPFGDPEAEYWARIGEKWAFLPDADTLRIDGNEYRLWGLDALQKEQLCTTGDKPRIPCGQQARDAFLELMSSVPPSEIRCFYPDQTHYPHTISCRAGDRDAGDWMVRQGYAFPTGQGRARYREALETAKSRRAGAWGTTFLTPWHWKTAACERISGMCREDYRAD